MTAKLYTLVRLSDHSQGATSNVAKNIAADSMKFSCQGPPVYCIHYFLASKPAMLQWECSVNMKQLDVIYMLPGPMINNLLLFTFWSSVWIILFIWGLLPWLLWQINANSANLDMWLSLFFSSLLCWHQINMGCRCNTCCWLCFLEFLVFPKNFTETVPRNSRKY